MGEMTNGMASRVSSMTFDAFRRLDMKRILSLTAFVALFSLSTAAYAGPGIGSTHYRSSSFARTHTKVDQKPFAFKGNQAQLDAGNYRYETELRWIAPHRSSRVVHVRVPSAQ
jgi:hypothetical protein